MVSGLRLSARSPSSILNQFASLRFRILSSFSGLPFKPKGTGRGPSVLAGTHGASDEISSPEILMEEGRGSDSVDGSGVGVAEGWV
jgi:hypothetical protein